MGSRLGIRNARHQRIQKERRDGSSGFPPLKPGLPGDKEQIPCEQSHTEGVPRKAPANRCRFPPFFSRNREGYSSMTLQISFSDCCDNYRKVVTRVGRTDTAKAIPEVSQPRWQFSNMNGSREKVIQMLCQLFLGGLHTHCADFLQFPGESKIPNETHTHSTGALGFFSFSPSAT